MRGRGAFSKGRAHFYKLFGVSCEYPLPLPLGEVAERSEDGEGKQGGKTLSVTFGDSSPKGRAKGRLLKLCAEISFVTLPK